MARFGGFDTAIIGLEGPSRDAGVRLPIRSGFLPVHGERRPRFGAGDERFTNRAGGPRCCDLSRHRVDGRKDDVCRWDKPLGVVAPVDVGSLEVEPDREGHPCP